MIILTLRSDKPEAEIGLYDGINKLAYETWQAHRQLAETLHLKIKQLLESQKKSWADVEAIVMYAGPGSFTGLRIGLSVGNALAYSNKIPAVGSSGENWLEDGLAKLKNPVERAPVFPKYGAEPHITKPRQ